MTTACLQFTVINCFLCISLSLELYIDVLTLGEQKGFQHVFPTTANSNWLSRSKMD